MAWNSITQEQIKRFKYQLVSDAEVVSDAVDWDICFINEKQLQYKYVDWSTETVDWDRVLNANWWAWRRISVLPESITYSIKPSADQNFSTFTQIAFDTEEIASNFFSLSWWEITVLKDCDVIVNVNASADNSTSTRTWTQVKLQLDNWWWYADVISSYLYHRWLWQAKDTWTIMIPMHLVAWYKLQAVIWDYNWTITCNTIAQDTILNIWTPSAWKGAKWDKWDTGSPWDLVWKWAWTTWTTANDNEWYEYNGSSYRCNINWTTSAPNESLPERELLAKKWADWAWSSVNISDNWTIVESASNINFVDFDSVNWDWSWNVTITSKKNEYIIQVRAEENSNLNANSYEWSFWNWWTKWWLVMYVPAWYEAKIVAMWLNIQSWTAEVEVHLNWVSTGANVWITTWTQALNVISVNVPVANWDLLQFYTTTTSWTAWNNVVTAFIKFTEL